jgi:hypothetical protein
MRISNAAQRSHFELRGRATRAASGFVCMGAALATAESNDLSARIRKPAARQAPTPPASTLDAREAQREELARALDRALLSVRANGNRRRARVSRASSACCVAQAFERSHRAGRAGTSGTTRVSRRRTRAVRGRSRRAAHGTRIERRGSISIARVTPRRDFDPRAQGREVAPELRPTLARRTRAARRTLRGAPGPATQTRTPCDGRRADRARAVFRHVASARRGAPARSERFARVARLQPARRRPSAKHGDARALLARQRVEPGQFTFSGRFRRAPLRGRHDREHRREVGLATTNRRAQLRSGNAHKPGFRAHRTRRATAEGAQVTRRCATSPCGESAPTPREHHFTSARGKPPRARPRPTTRRVRSQADASAPRSGPRKKTDVARAARFVAPARAEARQHAQGHLEVRRARKFAFEREFILVGPRRTGRSRAPRFLARTRRAQMQRALRTDRSERDRPRAALELDTRSGERIEQRITRTSRECARRLEDDARTRAAAQSERRQRKPRERAALSDRDVVVTKPSAVSARRPADDRQRRRSRPRHRHTDVPEQLARGVDIGAARHSGEPRLTFAQPGEHQHPLREGLRTRRAQGARDDSTRREPERSRRIGRIESVGRHRARL